MKFRDYSIGFGIGLLVSQVAWSHGPEPMPLQRVPRPHVTGTLGGLPVKLHQPDLSDPHDSGGNASDGVEAIVTNKQMAIALGKALFWDVNVGSDGMACGSCHFHAGADSRTKNQLNPGMKNVNLSLPGNTGNTFETLPSGAGSGGANYTLRSVDFPTFRYNDPFLKDSGIAFQTDDVVSSSGTFSGTFVGASKFTGKDDQCNRSADPVFHVNGTGTRRVEPRNAPTVINAIFNHRNFWDGRANNVYNGSSPWGERDANAGVWVKVNARTAEKQQLRLLNASLASLAMGPPLSDTEMSCQQRKWPDIGRKLILRQPLQNQNVHNEDSVLSSLSSSTPGNLKKGLNTTYKSMIMQAFNSKYWSYGSTGPFGSPGAGQAPYNQMEANFSMFFGLALQLYQGTLISDQAPIDLTPRDPSTLEPTWQGIASDQTEIDALADGYATFIENHCNLCHAGPTMTTASISMNQALTTAGTGKFYGEPALIPPSGIAYGPHSMGFNGAAAVGINSYGNVLTRAGLTGGNMLLDMGFSNTGVGDPNADPGLGGTDDFGNSLTYSDQYVDYLLGNSANIKDQSIGIATTRSCDFVKPIALNSNTSNSLTFTALDGVQADGSRPGETLRNQNCTFPTRVYIPTIAAANAALVSAPAKLAVSKKGVFKIPGLRNIELTGPYMHNGSMATLEQVIEFYSRFGNVDNSEKHSLLNSITLADNPAKRVNLIKFMKTFTDERVRFEKAPFDHPEIIVPNGHAGTNSSVTAGNPLNGSFATEEFMTVPAVGASGSSVGLDAFDSYLAP